MPIIPNLKNSNISKVLSVPREYPVVRGMASYAVLWPLCSVTQEYIEHGTTLGDADWARATRFGIFVFTGKSFKNLSECLLCTIYLLAEFQLDPTIGLGCAMMRTFFMAPVFYGWLKYSSRFFTSKTLSTAIKRSIIEQVTYSPLAMAYFFFGMSMLEMKPLDACLSEVKDKFWPTYKINVIFWPAAQTINFYFIPERHRIIFVSAASFVWTVYLAHAKDKENKEEDSKNASILKKKR